MLSLELAAKATRLGRLLIISMNQAYVYRRRAGEKAATLTKGVPTVLHGFKCLVLLDEEGNPQPTYSIAAGLDYPGIGPEHNHLKVSGRVEYYTVTNEEVLEAFQLLSQTEGIIPALESAHAVAYALKLAPTLSKEQIIIINLSGRGDKDVEQVFHMLK